MNAQVSKVHYQQSIQCRYKTHLEIPSIDPNTLLLSNQVSCIAFKLHPLVQLVTPGSRNKSRFNSGSQIQG